MVLAAARHPERHQSMVSEMAASFGVGAGSTAWHFQGWLPQIAHRQADVDCLTHQPWKHVTSQHCQYWACGQHSSRSEFSEHPKPMTASAGAPSSHQVVCERLNTFNDTCYRRHPHSDIYYSVSLGLLQVPAELAGDGGVRAACPFSGQQLALGVVLHTHRPSRAASDTLSVQRCTASVPTKADGTSLTIHQSSDHQTTGFPDCAKGASATWSSWSASTRAASASTMGGPRESFWLVLLTLLWTPSTQGTSQTAQREASSTCGSWSAPDCAMR